MCISMCTCLYIYIYVYTHTHTHTHEYIFQIVQHIKPIVRAASASWLRWSACGGCALQVCLSTKKIHTHKHPGSFHTNDSCLDWSSLGWQAFQFFFLRNRKRIHTHHESPSTLMPCVLVGEVLFGFFFKRKYMHICILKGPFTLVSPIHPKKKTNLENTFSIIKGSRHTQKVWQCQIGNVNLFFVTL